MLIWPIDPIAFSCRGKITKRHKMCGLSFDFPLPPKRGAPQQTRPPHKASPLYNPSYIQRICLDILIFIHTHIHIYIYYRYMHISYRRTHTHISISISLYTYTFIPPCPRHSYTPYIAPKTTTLASPHDLRPSHLFGASGHPPSRRC